MKQSVSLKRWSTDGEAPRRRLDFYAALLSSLQAPVQLYVPRVETFEAHADSADFGTISVVQQWGSPLTCREDRRGQGRDESRSYHLLLDLTSPWDAEHRGTHHCEPGDAMLFDATLPWKISHARPYEVINIKMSDAWLRQWVPAPAVLVGRPLRAGSGWGRALAGFAAQLSPAFLVHAPLPHSILIDHLGALLALAATQLSEGPAKPATSSFRPLAARVEDCIEQRCFEPGLTAEAAAQSVGVSVRTLHRCLASQQKSFGRVLVAARSDAAIRMLSSPMFRRLTIAEVAHRTGFMHPSHLSRIVRARTGRTPSELRRGFGAKADPADLSASTD